MFGQTTDTEMKQRCEQVRKVLAGLGGDYWARPTEHGQIPVGVRINGYSVIWHDNAYASEKTVEIRNHDGNIDAYVPLDELRAHVTRG